MNRTELLLTLLILITAFIGCVRNNGHSQTSSAKQNLPLHNGMKYASGFSMEQINQSTYITVFNPWKEDDTLATYLLLSDGNIENADSTNSDFIIKVPVDSVASLSSTFLAMFSLLGESKRISACTDAWLIYDSVLYARYLNNDLTNLGESMQLNLEAIVGHSSDLVMKYIYDADKSLDKRIVDAGIPIAYNLEYLEEHPLGRAEWIKFVAAFLGRQKIADSIFNEIEKSYLRYSDLITDELKRPTILAGSSYKGIWHAPGGKSFAARLLIDAGADYFWKKNSNRGGIPLSLESIIENQVNADFWIGPSSNNKEELLAIESRYALLKAFKTGEIYFFGKRVNPNGGQDYYESGVVHPDILLKDLISVFHPQLLGPDYETVYLEKVK